MDPTSLATTVAPATPGNFADHIASQDAANDNAIPDHSPHLIPGQRWSNEPRETGLVSDPGEPPVPETPAPEPEAPVEEEEQQPEPIGEAEELEQLRALKAELDGDALPAALASKTFQVKIDGRTYDVPISELAQGYQRQSDYSRKLADVKRERTEVDSVKRGAERLMQDLNDPARLIAAAKELGFYKSLFEAARQIGRQRLALAELSPEARQYALQLEEERDAREMAHRRAQQLEQRMQELQRQQPSQDESRMRHQLEQMVPRAFQKHKIGDYPLAREMFSQNLQNLHDGGDITAALIDAAAQATAEQLADIATRLPKERAANGMPPMPARRAAPAAAKPLPRQKGGTIADFASHLERLGDPRR